MGAWSSRDSENLNSGYISPEFILSEILGEIKDNDYAAKSKNSLENFVKPENIAPHQDKNDEIDINEAFTMEEPGYLKLEHGYMRRKNGGLYIAVYTDLGEEIDGEMFDWWIRNCDNDEKYRWWHPRDHKKCHWNSEFYSSLSFERKKSYYVGHIHHLVENIEGKTQSIQVEYLRTSKYFNVAEFEANNISTCMVGRMYTSDPILGYLAIGYIVHMVRKLDGGRNELRTRYWIGDFYIPQSINNFFLARGINYLLNTTLIRSVLLPITLARGIWLHSCEEMNCLKSFLPHYYKENYRDQNLIFRHDL